jgi:quercetin dioxygenase-like cupin family protein
MDLGTPKLFRWDALAPEPVTDRIRRKIVTGERVMLGQVWLDRDAVVPEHRHESEQLTWVFEGALRFFIAGETIVVRAGEVLVIPSQVPHEAVALEDTWEMDVFSPIRHDWLDGSDAYFRAAPRADAGRAVPASGANPATLTRWADVRVEALTPAIDRTFLSGARSTLADLTLRQGSVVPTHQHESEQLTWVRSGELELDVAGTVYRVPAGSVLRIPSGVPHRATAIEETRVVDAFGPRREDWLTGTDHYLRAGAGR